MRTYTEQEIREAIKFGFDTGSTGQITSTIIEAYIAGLPAPDKQQVVGLSFAEIKYAVAKIQELWLSISKDGNAIEANPATHRIAEFIQSLLASQPPVKMQWVKVEERLPDVLNEIEGESDYVLCIDMNIDEVPFVAWYNHKSENWTIAHHQANSLPASVTHWQPLPAAPVPAGQGTK